MRLSAGRVVLFPLFFLLFLFPFSLLAQEGEGALRGTVHSQAGAPLPDAAVTAKHLESGRRLAATADQNGGFRFSELAAGDYEFEVSQAGFAPLSKTGVAILAGAEVSLEFVLQPSGADAGPSGATDRISESQLVGLPLNGRSYSQLAALQAGITDTGGGESSRGVRSGNLSVSGGRSVSNNFLLDGTNIMDINNSVPRSAAGVQLGADAVMQVVVTGATYGAEYGRGSGGVLNSITRSGSDQFHGNLFEYLRNSKLDSRNFFDRDPLNPLRRSSPPPFKRNQFGFTLTGPIIKGRTYFMGSFEAMRDRLNLTQLDFYPDAEARLGIITNAAGQEVRRVSINPRVVPYLNLFPIPNSTRQGEGFARNVASSFLPTDEDFFSIRIDHKISDRDSFFVRYNFDDASSVSGQDAVFRTLSNTRQQYLTLVETHIFSLASLNSFRASYTRPVNAFESVSSITIPPNLFFVPGAQGFGQMEISGSAAFGPSQSYPEWNIMNTYQFADDVVLQRGAHTLKFGGEIHRYRWDVFNSSYKAALWQFSSLDSFLQGGSAGTNLIVSLPGSNNRKSFRQLLAGLYFQDNFRVTRRLQLNLGLRYEPTTVISERDGRIATLPDPRRDTQIQVGKMLDHNPSLLTFAPRLGFSWSPSDKGKTVVGGGLGVYYDPLLEYVVDLQKNTAPFFQRIVRPNFDSSSTFPDAVSAAQGLVAASPFQVDLLDYKNLKSPTVYRYNLSVQQEFAGWTVQAAYVGARGNHLFRGYEFNQYPPPVTRPDGLLFFPPNAGPLNPAFGAIRITTSDAQSFYNGLQVSASRSASRRLTLQTSYALSKSVDDLSGTSTSEASASTKQYPLMRTLERGLSDFDVRHRVSVSFMYVPPIGEGQSWARSGLVSKVLGGWRLGGIVSFRTGSPFHPLSNVRASGFLFTGTRPSLRPGADTNPTDGISAGCGPVASGETLGGPERYFDPCAYLAPDPGTLGNVGRNTIIGPSSINLDASMQKEFTLFGETRLQFRAEFFNVPNHTNFGSPTRGSAVVFSGFPARINGTAGSITRTSRQVQFALRLSF